jgi:hypothetical protein
MIKQYILITLSVILFMACDEIHDTYGKGFEPYVSSSSLFFEASSSSSDLFDLRPWLTGTWESSEINGLQYVWTFTSQAFVRTVNSCDSTCDTFVSLQRDPNWTTEYTDKEWHITNLDGPDVILQVLSEGERSTDSFEALIVNQFVTFSRR